MTVTDDMREIEEKITELTLRKQEMRRVLVKILQKEDIVNNSGKSYAFHLVYR